MFNIKYIIFGIKIKKNMFLKTSLILTKVVLIITIAIALVLITGIIYWHISPNSYDLVELTHQFKAEYGIGDIQVHLNAPSTRVDKVFISELNAGTMYWLFFRAMFFIGINLLILLKIVGILRSIRTIRTFYDTNIRNLKSIGFYAAIAAVMSSFNFGLWRSEWQVNFTIPWAVIMVSVIAFVLAEVFTEGKQLLEDKNMII
ncbi:MAG: hypothetical protein COA32_11580 [Fluviicola sp.]|nr:MAG: hypothetical protein COA32_11580 [Fluviicola sp.]